MAEHVYHIFHINADGNYLLFVFFSTIASYNLHLHYTQHVKVEHRRTHWSLQHQNIHLILFVVSAFVAGFFAWRLIDHWFELGIAVILTFLYTAPKFPFRSLKWLKNIAIGKTIFLSFVWTYVTTILPFLIYDVDLTLSNYAFTIARFFFIYAACIIFDYRDKEQDREEGIRSMITYFSERNILILFYISIALSILIYFLSYRYGMDGRIAIIQIVPCFILPFLFSRARKDFSDYLYAFGVDGMLVLPAILYYLIYKIS